MIFWCSILSILYAYAGYPLLLALLARIRPRTLRIGQGDFTPSVTLLIAAYNEQAVIGKKLDNALALDYPPRLLQILVAADGSDDKTPEIVRAYAAQGVELNFASERRGKMAAITSAMTRARGEIIVFSDANNHYQADTLRELIRPFSDPAVGVVSGAKSIEKDGSALGSSEGLYWKYESFIKKQEALIGNCVSVAGEILAIRKELFEPPPPSVINDDFFIAMQIARKGYRIAYAPDARSVEPVSPTAGDEISRRSRIIAGRYQVISMANRFLTLRSPLLFWQVVSHKFLRPLVPIFMISALASNIWAAAFPAGDGTAGILRLAPPYGLAALLVQSLFYAAAIAGSRFSTGGRLGRILYLPAFLVNSNYAALIGLYRFLTKKQSVLWERVSRNDK